MSGGRVSCNGVFVVCVLAGLEVLLRFERKREIMLESEKVWSELDGSRTAILSTMMRNLLW